MPNPWQNSRKLPPHAAAVLGALHLTESVPPRLNEREWHDALDYSDKSRITLSLGNAAREHLPAWVRDRIDRNADQNAVRLAGITETYRNLTHWLGDAGIEFLAIKGITHSALFGSRPDHRVQYDIDLWVPRETIQGAQNALIARGYESMAGMQDFPTDHLPALIRKTGWEWRGDFFDTEIPLPVELHFQFWNEDLERLPAPGVEEFWGRRTAISVAGVPLTVLTPADALAYAALHLLKHILRGSTNPFHIYEIACVLDSKADNETFWSEWRGCHPPQLRRLEAVTFRLAREWFGGRAAPVVLEELEYLPAATQAWFEEFAVSPAARAFHPNKDELWLHLSLLESRWDALRVARRRLLPGNLPPRGEAGYLPETKLTLQRRARYWIRWWTHFGARLRHHGLSLPRAAVSGSRWWWRTNSLGRQFWIFLSAAVVFNFALFIFFLLYNLFLMDLGFREEFLGVVNGAQRAGSVAGTLPAAYIAHRFGLRNTLLAAIAATAIAEVLRVLIGARFPLAALAFVSGCIFSVWAVILAPSIAAAVGEKRRPAAFSIFFATMFAVGIAGNWLGGRLPGWLHGKQPVLLGAAALSALALLPASRLRMPALPRSGARVYPRSPFLLRFLIPFALWHLATGAFNPFNNVYFARLGFAVERIGSIFSGSQVVQVITVLLAPLIIRRFGLLNGIVSMMVATALAMGALAAQPSAAAAIAAYFAYMAFQWMSEPGLNTMLMNQVEERERSGASALNYLAAFGAQALAAFAAGALLERFGYGVVLAGAAITAIAAAGLFRILLR